jgi:hypothetical protein
VTDRYDAAGRLQGVFFYLAGEVDDGSWSYGRDEFGRLQVNGDLD